MVDDFLLNEEVDVELAPKEGSYRVLRIAPSAWRDVTAMGSVGSGELDEINAVVGGREAVVVGVDRDGTLEIELSVDTYAPRVSLMFEGCCFFQLPLELPELRQVSAFAPDVFVGAQGELTKRWPVLPAGSTVFRLEPVRFRDAAAYVVAQRARLMGG